MQRSIRLAIPVLSILLGGNLVGAQGATPATNDEHAAHSAAKTTSPAPEKAHGGHDGHAGMMGGGMMGEGGMMCPGMLGPDAKFVVTKLAKGVTITITSDDPKVVARVQKMAEGIAKVPAPMTGARLAPETLTKRTGQYGWGVPYSY